MRTIKSSSTALFTQITAAANPHGACPSLFAIDDAGEVWQYITHPKEGGPAFWLCLNSERRIES